MLHLSRRALLLGTVVVAFGAIFIAANAVELKTRAKRSFLPFTLGHMTSRIKCADTTRDTVCAPGGPRDCPRVYRPEENRGACGFATISHFVSTGNIAGTCCIYDPTFGVSTTTKGPTPSSTPGSSTPKPASSTQGPRVVVYGVPVWGGYPNIPSYGDQSSQYGGSHGSPIYAIEAVNGPIATVSTNPGAYVGSRSFPDFKITEVRPQADQASPNARLEQLTQQQHVTSVTVEKPAAAVTTVKIEEQPILEKRQLYPPAASTSDGSGAASSSAPTEKGPLFYPYPALPQPKFVGGTGAGAGDSNPTNYPTAKIKRITVQSTGGAAPVRSIEDGDVKQIKSIDDMETF